MAIEYKLSYTANEINNKLGQIDNLSEEISSLSSEIVDIKSENLQQTPLFANSIEECTDTTKLYVLPDGYIYANQTVTEVVEKYQNAADPTSSDWIIGTRLGNSGLSTSDATKFTTTNPIPCGTGDKIYVEGATLTGNNCVIAFMNGSNVYLRSYTTGVMNGTDTSGYFSYTKDGDTDIFTVVSTAAGTYVRFCFFTPSNPEDIIISVNNPILPPEEVATQKWVSTSVKFIDVDYENSIVQEIIRDETRNNLESIQLTPEFATDTSECTDTSKMYVLPDGFIYAYMYTESTEEPPKNLLESYTDGGRLNSSYAESTLSGAFLTCYIPVKMGETLYFNGNYIKTDWSSYGSANWATYDADFNRLSGGNMASFINNNTSFFDVVTNAEGYVTQFTMRNTTWAAVPNWENLAYIRMTLIGSGKDCIITNQEHKEPTTDGGYAWANTGHAFVPADYEPVITELADDIQSLQDDVAKIEEQIEQGISNTVSSNIPSHWQEAIKSASERIKAARDIGGVHCVDFIWTTDIHGMASISEKGERFGHVAKAMMDAADIPMFVTTGDIMGKGSYSTAQAVRDELNLVKSWLNPIPYQMQALVMGNHDGAWGEQATGYYKKQLPMNEMYNLIYRKQSMDFRRVCDDDGTYYYIDNITQKMRFVFLNSQYQSSDETDANDNAIYDRFYAPYFGQKQLNWLINTALAVPNDYHVCLFTHDAYCGDWAQIVAIVNAFNATNPDQKVVSRTHTDSTYQWRSSTINADFTSKNGAIAAMFAGHIHYDCIRPASGENSMMACPLIQMTTALGVDVEGKTILFGGSQPDRADGTVTEFALDIPVINKKERTITIIRLGAGGDREVSY